MRLLEGNQGPKAARTSFLGTVRIPILYITGGTQARNLDLPHPGALQEQTIGLPEIEVDLAIM